MRWPLNGTITITGEFGATGGAYSESFFGKHIGTDFRATVGTAVYAPISGTIRSATTSASGNKIIELAGDDGRWHRFLHLSSFNVTGGRVYEGQQIARSGNSGGVSAHLHWDVRKANTAWNAAYSNYVNPKTLVTTTPPSGDMPAVGSKFKLIPVSTRTTFRAGTITAAGSIHVTNDSFIYTVRGYDPKFPGRVIINSKSAGGDGVALALYFVTGAKIPGWEKV